MRFASSLRTVLKDRLTLFRTARDGVAALEFAIILPLMLTMWLGTFEVGQAIAANRKSVLVSRTLADLTARATTISNSDMANIFAATAAVIYPFSSADLGMRVTSVKRDSAGANKVVWSSASGPGMSALGVGASVTLPTGILTAANQTVIMAEVKFFYKSPTGWVLSSQALTLEDKTLMVPRQVTEVTRTS
ncbi:TadE/TadG family type IV pilus assembly protein [Terrarubrum flagellatum]|uniref:TadE/TadG family type IV pilus assembly protein n=1 Tax=Terrirubrum flagellatum TaxID=2895980 RepID=UPI0031454849